MTTITPRDEPVSAACVAAPAGFVEAVGVSGCCSVAVVSTDCWGRMTVKVEPVPGMLPPECDEDETMEDGATQESANDENEDDERLSYRQEAFGADNENEDSDREVAAGPASKRQRTARLTSQAPAGVETSTLGCGGSAGRRPVAKPCIQVVIDEKPLKRVIDALTANCVALETSIAAKEAVTTNAVVEACTLEWRASAQKSVPQVAADEEVLNRSKVQALLSVAIASVSAKKILEDLSNRK